MHAWAIASAAFERSAAPSLHFSRHEFHAFRSPPIPQYPAAARSISCSRTAYAYTPKAHCRIAPVQKRIARSLQICFRSLVLKASAQPSKPRAS